jgi:hypothetical protein
MMVCAPRPNDASKDQTRPASISTPPPGWVSMPTRKGRRLTRDDAEVFDPVRQEDQAAGREPSFLRPAHHPHLTVQQVEQLVLTRECACPLRLPVLASSLSSPTELRLGSGWVARTCPGRSVRGSVSGCGLGRRRWAGR